MALRVRVWKSERPTKHVLVELLALTECGVVVWTYRGSGAAICSCRRAPPEWFREPASCGGTRRWRAPAWMRSQAAHRRGYADTCAGCEGWPHSRGCARQWSNTPSAVLCCPPRRHDAQDADRSSSPSRRYPGNPWRALGPRCPRGSGGSAVCERDGRDLRWRVAVADAELSIETHRLLRLRRPRLSRPAWASERPRIGRRPTLTPCHTSLPPATGLWSAPATHARRTVRASAGLHVSRETADTGGCPRCEDATTRGLRDRMPLVAAACGGGKWGSVEPAGREERPCSTAMPACGSPRDRRSPVGEEALESGGSRVPGHEGMWRTKQCEPASACGT